MPSLPRGPANIPPTSDRLRADIDSGRAGDKVGYQDPAAVPLGTDDEAAGNPPTSAQLSLAAEQLSHKADFRASGTLKDFPLLYLMVAIPACTTILIALWLAVHHRPI